jgi:hypothetical protein
MLTRLELQRAPHHQGHCIKFFYIRNVFFLFFHYSVWAIVTIFFFFSVLQQLSIYLLLSLFWLLLRLLCYFLFFITFIVISFSWTWNASIWKFKCTLFYTLRVLKCKNLARLLIFIYTNLFITLFLDCITLISLINQNLLMRTNELCHFKNEILLITIQFPLEWKGGGKK